MVQRVLISGFMTLQTNAILTVSGNFFLAGMCGGDVRLALFRQTMTLFKTKMCLGETLVFPLRMVDQV